MSTLTFTQWHQKKKEPTPKHLPAPSIFQSPLPRSPKRYRLASVSWTRSEKQLVLEDQGRGLPCAPPGALQRSGAGRLLLERRLHQAVLSGKAGTVTVRGPMVVATWTIPIWVPIDQSIRVKRVPNMILKTLGLSCLVCTFTCRCPPPSSENRGNRGVLGVGRSWPLSSVCFVQA